MDQYKDVPTTQRAWNQMDRSIRPARRIKKRDKELAKFMKEAINAPYKSEAQGAEKEAEEQQPTLSTTAQRIEALPDWLREARAAATARKQ